MMSPPNEWWVDSGATRHITNTKNNMVEFKENDDGVGKLFMGNSSSIHILREWTIKHPLPSGANLTFSDVLYAPDMRKN
ncbi:hypothetical protein AMTR_s00108p00138790 [Amborella trichopoda]|uniref:Retrovirus-related Pol polyprotein from transposon TNT 1-94-like beta-barrel domain-containing protein n=1 Tax=Amborella trichopoda TaxID=13333 RepID=W1NVR6_AMBTC|nr:hypothetical protein AMTR_s00108p00138790 [Amborella trichopoda]